MPVIEMALVRLYRFSGDEKYLNCMRNLHTACNDPIEIIAWREIYDIFERCCDTCENVADIVEGITIGNS